MKTIDPSLFVLPFAVVALTSCFGPSDVTLGSSLSNSPAQQSGSPSSSGPGSGPTSVPTSPPLPIASGAPQILYTDVTSGPSSSSVDASAILSVFGVNFGNSASQVSLKIGGAAVLTNGVAASGASLIYFGASKGRYDVEQLSVHVGALSGVAAGSALPVVLSVGGVSSNSDQTFIVSAGKMYYVDNVKGSDATGVAGDSTHPYRFVQGGTIWNSLIKPGDTIVMRGTGGTTTPWVDAGSSSRFLLFDKTDGSAPNGTSGGPYAVIGYPGEEAFIDYTSSISPVKGAISGYSNPSPSGHNAYFTLAGLHIEGGGTDGPVNGQVGAYYWRVINNELQAKTTKTGLAGGFAGQGAFMFILGNHIHDITCSGCETMHGVYIGGDAVGLPVSGEVKGFDEIAYNWIENVSGGSGIQLYDDDGPNPTINNVVIHHNVIHDVLKYLVNIGAGESGGVSAGDNIVIYDNVAYNGGRAGFYFDAPDLGKNAPCLIFNNTIYNGTFTVNTQPAAGTVIVENNILYQAAGSSPVAAFSGETFTDNLSGTPGDSNQSKIFSAVPSTSDSATGTALSSTALRPLAGGTAAGAGASSWTEGGKTNAFSSVPVFTFTDSTGKVYNYFLNSNVSFQGVGSPRNIGAF